MERKYTFRGKKLNEFLDSFGHLVRPKNIKDKIMIFYDRHMIRKGTTISKWESIAIKKGSLRVVFAKKNALLTIFDKRGTRYTLRQSQIANTYQIVERIHLFSDFSKMYNSSFINIAKISDKQGGIKDDLQI